MRLLRQPVGVLVVALVIALVAVVRVLAVFDWDPTAFTAFGEEAEATSQYAEEKLDRPVLKRPHQGHDGKYFFVQANDPWLLNPEENAHVLDRPAYRSQRMLYPVLAGGLGLFPAGVIIWALPIVNVLLLGLGSWAVAKIALKHGAPAWVGLAFVLNIGILSELVIDGAGVVAFACACLGVLALEDERLGWAAVAFSGSVLAREVMIVFVGLIALFWLGRRRRVPWSAVLPPTIALVGWFAYVNLWVGLPPATESIPAVTVVPFEGVVSALKSGDAQTLDLAVIGVFLALMVIVPIRAWKSNSYLTWGSVGFALLAPFLTVYVWQKSFDISRALAPLLTAFVLEFFINTKTAPKLGDVKEPSIAR